MYCCDMAEICGYVIASCRNCEICATNCADTKGKSWMMSIWIRKYITSGTSESSLRSWLAPCIVSRGFSRMILLLFVDLRLASYIGR